MKISMSTFLVSTDCVKHVLFSKLQSIFRLKYHMQQQTYLRLSNNSPQCSKYLVRRCLGTQKPLQKNLQKGLEHNGSIKFAFVFSKIASINQLLSFDCLFRFWCLKRSLFVCYGCIEKKDSFFYHFLAGELKNNMNMDNNRRWKCMQIWPFVKLGIHEQNRFQTVAYEGTSAFG